MPKHTNIYGLYGPQKLVDGDLDSIRYRYVGKSDNPLDRLEQHIHSALHNDMKMPVYDWIRKLDKQGVRPQMRVLCRVPMESWQKEERRMIATLRAEGHDLLNVTDGGDGWSSEEMKRMWADKEFRKKQSAAMNRPEVKAAMSAAQKRRYKDPAERAKKSAAQKRRYKDPAERAKTSATTSAAMQRPEVKAKLSAPRPKMSAAHKRPEVKAKLSAPRPKQSAAMNRPEVKAQHSAGMKRTWADPHYRAKRKIRRRRRKVMKFMLRRYGASSIKLGLMSVKEINLSLTSGGYFCLNEKLL